MLSSSSAAAALPSSFVGPSRFFAGVLDPNASSAHYFSSCVAISLQCPLFPVVASNLFASLVAWRIRRELSVLVTIVLSSILNLDRLISAQGNVIQIVTSAKQLRGLPL